MSCFADWLTIIGFIVIIFTFLAVKNNKKEILTLKKKNLFRNRISDNLSQLKKSSYMLANLFSDVYLNKREILNEISKLAPILKSIKKSLENSDLKYLELLKIEVDKHHKILII